MIKEAVKNAMALRPSKEDIQDQVLRIGGAAVILTGSIALRNATHDEHKATKRSPAVTRTYPTGQTRGSMLLPASPNPADRSPGTPDPEDLTPPVAGRGPNEEPEGIPIIEGTPNGTSVTSGPGAAESVQFARGQTPRLAFTGPMQITISPFTGDRSSAGRLVGQGGSVDPESTSIGGPVDREDLTPPPPPSTI